MTQSARFCQNHLARPSSLLPLSTVYRWLRSTTSLNALLLNRHTCNRFEQASQVAQCHSDHARRGLRHPASGTSAWRSPAGMADTCTSRYASLLNTHTWNRFEQASLIVECHSDCALDNSFFRVIHADPSAHPRRNGRLRVDMKPLPLGRCSRRVHSVRLRRLKDLANAFGHASEAQRRRFALPGPLFPKWQLPAQKRPCRVWTAVRGDRWPHC